MDTLELLRRNLNLRHLLLRNHSRDSLDKKVFTMLSHMTNLEVLDLSGSELEHENFI